MHRLFYFVQDLAILIALVCGTGFALLVFNPPTVADQTRCQALNGGGLDYTACVIDRIL